MTSRTTSALLLSSIGILGLACGSSSKSETTSSSGTSSTSHSGSSTSSSGAGGVGGGLLAGSSASTGGSVASSSGQGGAASSTSSASSSSGVATSTSSSGATTTSSSSSSSSSSGSTSSGLHVVKGSGGANGHIVDGSNTPIHLHGADLSGTEYACLYGQIFDAPGTQATLTLMKGWNINAVRVPLNEDCWLGINGVPSATSGTAYQQAIRTWVSLIEQNGMYAILDLHWAAPGSDQSNGQLGMADDDHAPTFWSQVATAYGAENDKVIFDLFNEPFITDWGCWLQGGMCSKDSSGNTYQAAGMATLLKAVRGAGANNVVIMGGLGYSSDFSSWLAQVNSIPTLASPLDGLTTDNIAASWHTYADQNEQTSCPSEYDGYSGTCASGAGTAQAYGITTLLAGGYPFIAGEIGIPTDSSNISPYTTAQAQMLAAWLESTLTWIDGQEQNYLAWDWSTAAGPLLITDYSTGAPSPYFGQTYQMHLMAF